MAEGTVSLREHLEAKIQASHNELSTEIKYLRAEQAAGQLQSSKEHAEVHKQIGELKGEISQMRGDLTVVARADASQAVAVSVLWKAAAAVGGLVTTVAALSGVVSLFIR